MSEDRSKTEIKFHQGYWRWIWVFASFSCFFLVLGIVLPIFQGNTLAAKDWFSALLFLVLGIAGNIVIPSNSSIAVSKNQLRRKRVFKQDITFPWDKVSRIVDEIVFIEIYLDSPVNGVHKTRILMDFLVNPDELRKAVIEAAFLANSQVSIDPRLLQKYGSPPYGIFSPKEDA